jgi:hypothetical protein
MPPGEVPLADLQRLAAGKFGVEQGVAPDALRAVLLRRLRDEDYLPDPALHEAMRLLSGRPIGPESWLQEEAAGAEQERLRGEVEAFASAFFTIPVAERRQRWQSLLQACTGHEPLRDRLLALKLGLDVDRGRISNHPPAVRRLADLILALFVLRPGPRAALRRELVRDLLSDPALPGADLRRARKRLMRVHPEVATISDGLLLQLARPERPLSAVRRRSRIASVLHRNVTDEPAVKSESQGLYPVVFSIWFALGVVGFLIAPAFNAKKNPSGLGTPPPALSREQVVEGLFPRLSSDRTPSPQSVRAFHEEFKLPIARELAKFGRALDGARLQQVVDALPSDVGSRQPGGLAASMLFGLWTEKERDRYAACLKKALVEAGVSLDDTQLDAVALGALPQPVDRPSRGRGSAPGRASSSGLLPWDLKSP